ncbi:MAG TPA: murein L,D-transpeptidase catalytic domain family protein [Flavobacterium sp.]|nr:murein L,D-transpeptidase catalytic domain family protein [Flavobacterium sp.]
MIQKVILICLLQFVSCNKPEAIPAKKDYSAFHKSAVTFCKAENFNTDYYFLIDLSLHSGKNRFFVCDLKTNKILNEGLVTHGSCDVTEDNGSKWGKAKFNNANNSHCSAKGKYKIGKRDSSAWGIKVKYWLYGLEKTNNNATERVVVLHSWDAVSNVEVYPKYSPLSWGCPAVSDEFMTMLDAKLQLTAKPVLLWIIE